MKSEKFNVLQPYIKQLLTSTLQGQKYTDSQKVKSWTQELSERIKERMKVVEPVGWKFIVSITINENHNQASRADLAVHWGPEDTVTHEVYTSTMASTLNPTTPPHDLEFGGKLGTFAITFFTPIFIYILFFACNESTGCPSTTYSLYPDYIKSALGDRDWWVGLWDSEALVMFIGWYAFCVLMWAVIPGEWVEGTLMRNGKKKSYKINAFSSLILVSGLVAGQIIRSGPASFTFLYDHYLGLITATVLFSIVQAFYTWGFSYVRSNKHGEEKLLALAGNSGNFFYDFWMGRELNPSIWSFDLKTFNELRPGLILWAVINVSCACAQYVHLGGRVTDSMVLVVLFQGWYVFDALYLESAIFTQMDITTDGAGFMLILGCLAWVPFTYTLQSRYLAFHPVDLGIPATAAIVALNALGYYIFRQANVEKNEFRKGGNPYNLEYMETKRGTKLLTSGWWGRSRHPNYLGDWLMSWAWCLPCGFSSPIPYFYMAYFGILLIHRQMRDDEACAKKYGDDWKVYCQKVKYRIIPYVY